MAAPSIAFAANEAPRSFTLDGRIFTSPTSTTPLLGAVTINVKILDPAGTCVLYEEEQSYDTTLTDGRFNVAVGSPTSDAQRTGDDPNHPMANVYQNSTLITATNAGCAAGYTPAAGDTRAVRITVTPTSPPGAPQVFSPDMRLDAVPTAIVAETVQGLSRDNMLELNTNIELTQANIENVFSVLNYPKLTALLAGTSSDYMKATPAAAVSFNNQRITSVDTPTAGTDAANKNYADGYIGGKVADTVGLAAIGAGDSGKVMVWDGAKWTAAAPSGDSTKLPLAGGTMTGPINMGSQNISASGHISMSSQTTLHLGKYTNAQETTLSGALVVADAGKVWYNSDAAGLQLWNGSASIPILQSGSTAGGDLTGTYPSPTIAAGAVTTNKLFANPGINRLVMTDGSTGASLAAKSCGLGKVLKWTATGWDCGDDDNSGTVTGIATGTGLTGGPITTVGTISIANNGITAGLINSGAVTSAAILDSTIATADIASSAITAGLINTGAVTSAGILDATIANADIASNAIRAAQINTGAVTSAGILDGAIVAADLNSTITNGLWTGNGFSVGRASGYVGIGTTQPSNMIHLRNPYSWGAILIESESNSEFYNNYTKNDANGGLFSFYKSRGTLAAESIVQDGDTLGTMQFGAYDATNVRRFPASISAQVDGGPANYDVPARLLFSTSPDGAYVPVERMRITNAGNVGIGTTSPGAMLDIAGQFRTSGTTPTLGSCGTAPSITGTNQSGRVTMGSGALTSCTINFSATLANAPNSCVLMPANATAAATGTTGAYVSSISTASWVVTGLNLTDAIYYYQCF